MMELILQRFTHDGESTLGMLTLDGAFQCFTLEDAYRKTKIFGRTRINAGTYSLIPRHHGRIQQSHKRRWGHPFVIEIANVPLFTDVLIHCGNNHEHTKGCVLVGDIANATWTDMSIGASRVAYERLYGEVCNACSAGSLTLTIRDETTRTPDEPIEV